MLKGAPQHYYMHMSATCDSPCEGIINTNNKKSFHLY